jgi:hypothetical protein
MASEAIVGYVATWVLANGSALGVVYKLLTAPIDARIAILTSKVEALEKLVSPRQSITEGAPTMAELMRRIEELEDFRRAMDEFRGEVVTDDEFRSYTQLAGGKIETILARLGWIKGRLGGREDDT